MKAFLREFSPKAHWHIDEKKAYDTYFCLSNHIKNTPNVVLKALQDLPSVKKSSYFDYWNIRKQDYEKKRELYIQAVEYSDFLVYEKVLKSIPNNYQLQSSNSSTIRYTQLFNLNPSISVFCNRGTSGIDGSTSTAIGASIVNKAPTLLVTGDLSFLYDSNAFWNSYIRKDFRVIVINNEGGGIFRILPGKEESHNYRTFFETSHSHSAKHISDMYGLEYSVASSEEKVGKILKDFYKMSEKPKLLEIKTPRIINDKILFGYFDFIS